MEALGAILAVTSLTIQLVQGVEQFQTFFEECRDPSHDVHDLFGQLVALRQLLELIENEAPEHECELVGDTSLKDEISKSKMRFDELTNLVSKCKAGSASSSVSSKGGKIRMKNYLKIHSQQRKMRRFADKLNRTRTTILDHYHYALMSNVKAVRENHRFPGTEAETAIYQTDQETYSDIRNHPQYREYADRRRQIKQHSATQTANAPCTMPEEIFGTGGTPATGFARTTFTIEGSGSFTMYSRKVQNVADVCGDAKVTMFKTTKSKKKKRFGQKQSTPSGMANAMQSVGQGFDTSTGSCNCDSRRIYRDATGAEHIHYRAAGNATFNEGNQQGVCRVQESAEIVMFEGPDEEDEDEADEDH